MTDDECMSVFCCCLLCPGGFMLSNCKYHYGLKNVITLKHFYVYLFHKQMITQTYKIKVKKTPIYGNFMKA